MSITINHQTNDISIAGGGSPTLGGSAAGGGAWNLINTTTVTSAVTSVDFTSIGSYDSYVLKWDCTMDGSQIVRIRFYDNGTLITSSDYAFLRTGLSGLTSAQTISTGVIGTAGMHTQIGTFEISPTEARVPYRSVVSGLTAQSANTGETTITSGGMKSTYTFTSLTGLSLTTTAATAVILTGRFSLYGLTQ
jgi:hypothetical protein